MRLHHVLVLLKALYQGTEININNQSKTNSKKGFFARIEQKFAKSFFAKRALDIGVEIFRNIFYIFLAYILSMNLLSSLHAGIPAELVLGLAPLSVFLFALLFGLFYTKEALFNTKDNDLLLAMPFSATEVLASRILYVVLISFSHLMVMHFGTAAFLYFSGALNASLSQILTYLFVPLLVNISLVLLSAVLLFPLYYVFQKIKKIKVLDGLFTILILIISMSFSIFYNLSSFELHRAGQGMIKAVLDNLALIGKVYPPYQLYLNMVLSENAAVILQNLLMLVLLLVILGTVLYALAHKMYFSIISQMGSVNKLSAKSLKREQAKAGRLLTNTGKSKNTVWRALVYENKKMFSDSTVFAINHFLIPLILPLVIIGSAVFVAISAGLSWETLRSEFVPVVVDFFNKDWQAVLAFYPEVEIYIFIGLAFALFFFPTPIFAYVFSKEGKSFAYLRALPVNEYQLYFSRAFYVFGHQLYVDLFVILGVALLFAMGLYPLALLGALMVFVQAFTNGLLNPLLDLWKPAFEFNNEQQVMKRNFVSLLGMLPSLVIFGLPVAFFIVVLDIEQGLSPAALNLPLLPLLYLYFFVILIIELILLKVLVPKLIRKVV